MSSPGPRSGIEHAVEQIAGATSFSGAVRVDFTDGAVFERAYGFTHRGLRTPNTMHTRFGTASATKGLTALTVMSLVEDGVLGLDTTARSLLGDDLPLIAPDVTVEHLLGHRSGIGDYLDESTLGDITDHVLPVPVHVLATTEAYLPMLAGRATAFPADSAFAYCNGGYVVVALLAERAAGVPFHDLVHTRVCTPAGMTATGFPRSDEPDALMAAGYLHAEGLRTNVFHLPVRGSGDGGAYTTTADVHALWTAVFAGRIVRPETVAAMVHPRSTTESGDDRYGLGFWLHRTSDAVSLEGYDAGVSFRSVHHPGSRLTHTVIANTSEGAWPITKRLSELLDELPAG
ncbi:MAG: serine hydrolase domain-containing protein [Actinomycetota bacterium]|nr:serine hydrolase domain-containing protein [Actinomycetota bacterium]